MDRDGHVANFNETEQILIVDKSGRASGATEARLSFVQVRGSIPLYWSEINNLRYKPELYVMELPDTVNEYSLYELARSSCRVGIRVACTSSRTRQHVWRICCSVFSQPEGPRVADQGGL